MAKIAPVDSDMVEEYSPPSPAKPAMSEPSLTEQTSGGSRMSTYKRTELTPEFVSANKSYDELLADMGVGSSSVTTELDPEKMMRDVHLLKTRMAKMGKGLLNPRGKLMTYWDFATITALMWTATITPYEVCLMWAEKKFADPVETWLDWLFVINIFIDLVFLTDMCFNFFLPYTESIRKGGGTVKSHRKIAKNYLTGWFPIDITSMLPINYFLMFYDTSQIKNANSLRLIRIIRLLRLLKLARILRASRIFSRWENKISLSYGQLSLIKLFIGISVLLHWLACILGLFASFGAGALRTEELELKVQAVIDAGDSTCWGCTPAIQTQGLSNSICKQPCMTSCEISTLAAMQVSGVGDQPGLADMVATQESLIRAQEAWVCRYSNDGVIRAMPDYHGDIYWAALYVAMIQLGGGVGSIVPTNMAEYILFWVCIFSGSVFWAYVVGTICAVLTTSDPATLQFKQDMDSLNYFLSDLNMPDELSVRAREYLRNRRDLYKKKSYTELMDLLSNDLRNEVVMLMSKSMICKVWFFQDLEESCLVLLSLKVERTVFAPREKVPCNQLNILIRGVAAKSGNILTPVTSWGEDIIVTAKALRDKREASALTYIEIAFLSREVLEDCLSLHPKSAELVQQAAMKIAMQRAIVVVSEFIRVTREQSQTNIGVLGGGGGGASLVTSIQANLMRGKTGPIDGAEIIPYITGMPLRDPEDDEDAAEAGGAPYTPRGKAEPSGEDLEKVLKKLEAQSKEQKSLAAEVGGLKQQLATMTSLLEKISASSIV